MNKFRILEKKELDGYDCFSLFDYFNKIACITDFAIASGTFSYENSDNLRAAKYWINETWELNYNYAYIIDEEGRFKLFDKFDKHVSGLRISGKYSDMKNYITGQMNVNEDLSVGEIGYFPTKVFNKPYNPRKLVNTGIIFQLPVLERGMFNTFDLSNTPIYEYNGNYILQYENQKTFSTLSDGQTYNYKEDIIFELEPIRIWIDKVHDLFLSQDIIMSGIAFKSEFGASEYDDYTESDIYRALSIFENNIDKSMNLYDKTKIKRKKCK